MDDDKAISDFMTTYNLTDNVPPQSTTALVVRYTLIMIGSLMILASIILYLRKWYDLQK